MLNIRITDVNIPTGSTAVLAGTKPDGTVYSQAGTLAGNTATFAEDVQMTAVAGTWDAKITVTNGGNCICTARITITIDPDTVAGGAVPSDSQLDGIIAECRAIADSVRKEAYGSPLVADAVEDMTDQSRVYVYTGSESGMTAGHWYYYNGSAWADGGVYNAVAVDTDTTLTIAGKAADAKEVGDQLTSVKENLNAVFVVDSASGSVAHFTDGADDVAMKSVNVSIAPVQSGSGDPSPSNVRAISGWDSVKVTRAGKNLLPNTAPDTITKSGVTATKNSDGSITLNGTATANANFEVCGFADRLMPFTCKGQLTLTGCPADGSTTTYRLLAYFYKDGAYTGTFFNDTGGGSTVDVDADHVYSIISVYNGQTYNNLIFYPMLRLASDTDGTYEPYNGNTYNISLSSAGTVYGGTLDAVSGELTVDKVATVGLSSYTKASGVSDGGLDYYDFAPSNYKLTESGGVPTNISSHLAMKNGNTAWASATPCATANATRLRLYIESGTESSYSDMVVVYTLATPLTYQLSATEVKSLLGNNNVWSDAGDMDVEYRADTKLYIDKRLGV